MSRSSPLNDIRKELMTICLGLSPQDDRLGIRGEL